MTTLICITNDLNDVRSCTFHNEHLDGCTGVEVRWDPDRAEHVYTDRECRGCFPRPAERGLLCWACAAKWDQALKTADDIIPHLRSVEKGPSDGVITRPAPGSRVILPTSWIVADDLWALLTATADGYANDWAQERLDLGLTVSSRTAFHPEMPIDVVMAVVKGAVAYLQADPDRVIAGQAGAAHAVRFTRRLQRALTEYPLEEKSRPIQYIRCRACHQHTLRQNPPLQHEGPIVIVCSNLSCKAEYDLDLIMTDLTEFREQLAHDPKSLPAWARESVAAAAAEARGRTFAPDYPADAGWCTHSGEEHPWAEGEGSGWKCQKCRAPLTEDQGRAINDLLYSRCQHQYALGPATENGPSDSTHCRHCGQEEPNEDQEDQPE